VVVIHIVYRGYGHKVLYVPSSVPGIIGGYDGVPPLREGGAIVRQTIVTDVRITPIPTLQKNERGIQGNSSKDGFAGRGRITEGLARTKSKSEVGWLARGWKSLKCLDAGAIYIGDEGLIVVAGIRAKVGQACFSKAFWGEGNGEELAVGSVWEWAVP
jgi:hypothetical protein